MQMSVFLPLLLWTPLEEKFLSLLESVISTLNYFALEN